MGDKIILLWSSNMTRWARASAGRTARPWAGKCTRDTIWLGPCGNDMRASSRFSPRAQLILVALHDN
eukprot:5075297-Pyramimonas_sp.AAC.1